LFVRCRCYNNAYFARVGGISLVEMNYLEVDFLFGIAFDLNVTPGAFASYCSVLQSEMAYLDPPPAPVEAARLRLQHYCAGPSSNHDDAAVVAAVAAAGCHRNQQPQLSLIDRDPSFFVLSCCSFAFLSSPPPHVFFVHRCFVGVVRESAGTELGLR
jgi:hypothetical protein